MCREEESFLDIALIDTVADGEELIVRAQALAHETEERMHALTGADPPHSEEADSGEANYPVQLGRRFSRNARMPS